MEGICWSSSFFFALRMYNSYFGLLLFIYLPICILVVLFLFVVTSSSYVLRSSLSLASLVTARDDCDAVILEDENVWYLLCLFRVLSFLLCRGEIRIVSESAVTDLLPLCLTGRLCLSIGSTVLFIDRGCLYLLDWTVLLVLTALNCLYILYWCVRIDSRFY